MSQLKKRLPFWEFALILFSTIYFIVPGIAAMFPFYVFLFVEIFYSAYLIFKRYIKASTFFKFAALIVLVALMYTFLNDAGSISSFVSNRLLKRFISKFMQYSCMFFPLIFLKRFIQSASDKQSKVLILASITSFILASIPVLQLIAIDPLAARDFGQEQEGNFIPPFPFVYGMTFVFVGSFLFVKNTNPKYWVFRSLSLLVLLFSFYFLLQSQFTLSLVTSFITIVLIITCGMKSSGTRLVFIYFIFLLLCVIPFLLEYLIIPNVPDMLASRFEEVQSFFTGNLSDDSDLAGRFELYGKSIAAFFRSPLIGNRYLDFDGHATYLMVWADLGILGGVAVFSLLFRAKKLVQTLIVDVAPLFLPCFLHLFLNGLTNPIHASLQIYITLWFIIPLTLNTYKSKLI